MLDILIRAGSYVAIIALGYLLKRVGFFKDEDFPLLSRIVIRVTLPCAIISSSAGMQVDLSMLAIIAMGFGAGVLYMLIGYFMNRKTSLRQQAFEVLNLPGYAIGTFTLPFAQGFLGSIGVLTSSLFDIGNACICLGGAGHIVRQLVLQREQPFLPKLHSSGAGDDLGAGIDIVTLFATDGQLVFIVAVTILVPEDTCSVLVDRKVEAGQIKG